MPSYGMLRRVALVRTDVLSKGRLLQESHVRGTIPEGGIFHSHRHENLKSYIALTL
jgi:hypothetical protein